jgi:hypothetical protein
MGTMISQQLGSIVSDGFMTTLQLSDFPLPSPRGSDRNTLTWGRHTAQRGRPGAALPPEPH